VHVLEPIALERPQIVGIAQFIAQLLEYLPVSVASGEAMLDSYVDVQIGLERSLSSSVLSTSNRKTASCIIVSPPPLAAA
jgi:hypothetical protein